MNRKQIICLVIACFAVTTNAMAWAGLGHSAIAYIAEQHLTPEAKAKCHHYLKHTLAYEASWMDYWRNIDPYKESNYWHSMKGDRDNKLIRDTRNAPVQIARICKEMKEYKKLSDEQVQLNLRLIIHMVGDMHCPSHVTYPKQGFKRPSLLLNGKKLNGHAVWDASPRYLHPGWTIVDYQRNLDTKSAKERKAMVKGTVFDWADEMIAQMRVTGYIFERNTEFTEMDGDTVEKMRKINDEQIVKAGYRLAHVLNRMFKR